MKKVMLLLCAVFAVAVMGAEAKKSVWQLWQEGGWNNWTEVIKQAESGAVEVKGQEWLVEMARYKTKTISAEECWKRVKDHQNTWQVCWEVVIRILLGEPADSPIVATVKAQLDNWLAGKDNIKRNCANLAYGRYYAHEKVRDYAKSYNHYLAGKYSYGFATVAGAILGEDSTKASQIYKDTVSVMMVSIDGISGKQLLTLLNKSAILANIPAAEVVSTLTTIQRLYADKAVGDSKKAKEWGIFLGSLRDVIASWK